MPARIPVDSQRIVAFCRRALRDDCFTFPGDSGQDVARLKGKQFQSIVKVAFEHEGQTYTSAELVLVPHTQ
jgi:hypothetical protein